MMFCKMPFTLSSAKIFEGIAMWEAILMLWALPKKSAADVSSDMEDS